jgi:hypothetical protein
VAAAYRTETEEAPVAEEELQVRQLGRPHRHDATLQYDRRPRVGSLRKPVRECWKICRRHQQRDRIGRWIRR